ncbi:hypothetical protein MYX64_06895 [Nitrospinae bacterium AH_259_B05_G02_I21]|nr:hypothetical protein [Nitrospinae bacterium AH_259_B05_G02_I21]
MGEGLKSAYERALERLKDKGMEPVETALTDEQKREIAEIRKEFEAKIAELEIMMQSSITEAHAEGEESEPRFASKRASLMEEMEKRVEAVRRRAKKSS